MIAAPPKPEAKRIEPQAGPQLEAFKSQADILIYGGQAGGGKSWFLVHEPLRRVHNAGFRGGIFRRTYPQLKGQGGVWDECQEMYRALGARMREGQELDATFPSGANISFLHLQHEKTKYEYQGHQFCYLGFDELTHFTETQFFYMLSRNRSTCGIRPYVRATCNPEPGWLADFLAWWIDDKTGLAIPERSGVLRYFIRDAEEKLHWADTKEELLELFPDYAADDILSVTFISASLDDNPALTKKDPGYRARLLSLSKIERDRLLGGNWRVAEGSKIDESWIRYYHIKDNCFEFSFQRRLYQMPFAVTRRIATIDTAGTSKEIAAQKRGKKPSWSVCQIWDICQRWAIAQDNRQVILSEFMFLQYVWRKQVDWGLLKVEINETLGTWNVQKAYVENAHFGAALVSEIRSCQSELIGPVLPGMGDHGEGAKLERAIASGMLSRFEQGKIFIPYLDAENEYWLRPLLSEFRGWTGDPEDEADQIDTTSYATYVSKISTGTWGGPIPAKKVR